ncbi:hypothetical protein ACFL55_00580 [Candidatus Latescibacterota bacterium]
MSMRTRLALLLVCGFILGMFTTGCNIFDFASDAEKTNTERAEDYIREGNYQDARDVLADAVSDSTDSHALYLDAKAALYEAGVDIVEIVNLIEGQNASAGDNLGLLEVIDGLSDDEQTAWYQANLTVAANLGRIFHEQTTGPFKPSDVALGYTVSNVMSGILGLRDTNRDGVIDDNDFNLDLEFFQSAEDEGFSITGGSYEDDLGNIQSFSGLEIFLGGYTAKASGTGVMEGYEPDDINDLIVFVMGVLENSRDALIVLLEKNISSFEPSDIEKYVDQIASLINFYWYDDGIDTDEDGQIDEETINGVDDDGDGLIDEDTGYHPADPTNTRNTQYYQIWLKWRNQNN